MLRLGWLDICLLFDVDPRTPARLLGDPLRIGQILTNFASNAVKFTPAGGEVVLRVAVVDECSDQVALQFSVRDSGVGMSEEQLGRLFRPFTQADASTTRAFGGTGLGLTICKDLVELMGGTIWAESVPSVGSTFHCRIPLEAASDSTVLGCLRSGDLPRLRVLVVDDHRTARQIFSSMLTGFGVRVEETHSGARAVEMVAAAEVQGDPFDLLLVDWHMPELDGIETVRQLRAHAGIEDQPATILVTAYDRDDAQRAAADIPVDAFLEKPATRSSIFDTLMNVVAPDAGGGPTCSLGVGEAVTRSGVLAGRRVLVVEDNPVNQQLAVELLTMHGLETTVAGNGAEALEVLRSGRSFDGVLMDCQMPVMDGYEATRRIRAIPELAELPVIAMTANAMSEDVARATEAGMNGHVAKPIDVQHLFSTLATWLAPEVDRGGTGASEAPTPQPDLLLTEVPGLDTAAGLAVAAGNVRLYLELLEMFRESNDSFAASFAAARSSEDPVADTRLAHSLKGTASSLGAVEVAVAAKHLEAACERHDEARVEHWAAQTQQRLDRLLPELDRLLEPERSRRDQAEADIGERPSGANGIRPGVGALELLDQIEEGLASSDSSVVGTISSLEAVLHDRLDCREVVQRLTAAARAYDFDAAAATLHDLRTVLAGQD